MLTLTCYSLGTVEHKALWKAQKEMFIYSLSISGTSHSAWQWAKGEEHKALFPNLCYGDKEEEVGGWEYHWQTKMEAYIFTWISWLSLGMNGCDKKGYSSGQDGSIGKHGLSLRTWKNHIKVTTKYRTTITRTIRLSWTEVWPLQN